MAACGVIRRGFSTARDPATAVREFSEAIAQPDIGLIVFFCSFTFDLDVLEPELRRAFEGLHVIGCTTAGEIAPTGYLDGAITGIQHQGLPLSRRQRRDDRSFPLPDIGRSRGDAKDRRGDEGEGFGARPERYVRDVAN